MDVQKIGRFIGERRKAVGLTQFQLAEKLNITDRAVSKWETGRSLPDSSIMLELCNILGIGVNDLLKGEIIAMSDYNKKLEENLLDMVRQKELADKRLLKMEIVVGGICLALLLALTVFVSYVQMEEWLKTVLILIGLMPLLAATPFMLKIEQTSGYYECAKCGHRYVPTYKAVTMAMHMGRTRYMKCPECGRMSWQKKVISKE